MKSYDLVVIGSGPGGYVAAIRGSQLGLKTAIIEKSELGGVCLNWGCIPTKALLDSAHLYDKIKKSQEFGIKTSQVEIDFPKIIQRSRSVANRMSKGVEYLMKKNQIDVYYGFGKFKDTFTIQIFKQENSNEVIEELQTKKTIIAVGARAKNLPHVSIDNTYVIDYKKAMTLESLPKKLLIVGGGAIGVEFADIYNLLGTEVTLIEILPQILPNEDEEISKTLQNIFSKRNIKIHTQTTIREFKIQDHKVHVELQKQEQEIIKEDFDHVLLAVGIQANTENLNLDKVFVDLKKDKIIVNSYYQTTNPNIYAIGDCIETPALAHVASHEGIRAAEHAYLSLKKEKKVSTNFDVQIEPIRYQWIPSCVYSQPEIASVGLTEKKAKELNYNYIVGKFPYQALGRAHAANERDGFVKVLIDKKTHKILGIHIIGKNATEIIGEGMVSLYGELLPENIAKIMHPHPTISESLMEAFAQSIGEPINI
ncbi:MAG: dihydrolipoyl dehydrogenase [Leptospiraceae bacterium]|nr:dihydrolipoyl dehydrogenase [Leptospiraceae bacterium]MDW7975254.1 dihydrolipoyl dehydrogenase [Leptospiraceae bacterium]